MTTQPNLETLWAEHLRHEFDTKSTADTLLTMVQNAYVNHVPVMTGGYGKEALDAFYSTHFIPKMPADAELVPISRTVGLDRLVDEFIFKFTHDMEMDWMLPGIQSTHKRVEVPFVGSCSSRATSWPTSTSTGTKPRYWRSLGCWSRATCPSPASRRPPRLLTRSCRPTS